MSVTLTDAQFQELIRAISRVSTSESTPATRASSFTTATFTYDGERDPTRVKTFITAASCYKRVEKMNDEDALNSLPLVLKDDAAVWWNGVSESVTTWEDFKDRLHRAFAPSKPASMIYQELISGHQKENELTETFIAAKRDLLAQLPSPRLPESTQLDMIYGTLNKRIREKVARETITSFDDLLKAARSAEELFDTKPQPLPKERIRCSFCKNLGHSVDVCRKKEFAESKPTTSTMMSQPAKSEAQTQMPSLSTPTFTCYGCGAPGVVRANCSTCTKKPHSQPIKKEDLSFCAVDDELDDRSRPVICISIKTIQGYAYVDTCAKSSVASWQLYCQLKEEGYKFTKETVKLTMADGVPRKQEVLKVKVDVKLATRTIPTMFVVLPESRDNRTLLGSGFMQDALMVVNIPQFTWWFLDEPDKIHELYQENFLKFDVNSNDLGLSKASVDSFRKASHVTAVRELDCADNQASKAQKKDNGAHYRLHRLEEMVMDRKYKTFDGYSPHLDYMFKDAQINVEQDKELNIGLIEFRSIIMDSPPTTVPLYRLSAPRREIPKHETAYIKSLGPVLVQGERLKEHPVEYSSRLLTLAEKNYSTRDRKEEEGREN